MERYGLNLITERLRFDETLSEHKDHIEHIKNAIEEIKKLPYTTQKKELAKHIIELSLQTARYAYISNYFNIQDNSYSHSMMNAEVVGELTEKYFAHKISHKCIDNDQKLELAKQQNGIYKALINESKERLKRPTTRPKSSSNTNRSSSLTNLGVKTWIRRSSHQSANPGNKQGF